MGKRKWAKRIAAFGTAIGVGAFFAYGPKLIDRNTERVNRNLAKKHGFDLHPEHERIVLDVERGKREKSEAAYNSMQKILNRVYEGTLKEYTDDYRLLLRRQSKKELEQGLRNIGRFKKILTGLIDEAKALSEPKERKNRVRSLEEVNKIYDFMLKEMTRELSEKQDRKPLPKRLDNLIIAKSSQRGPTRAQQGNIRRTRGNRGNA